MMGIPTELIYAIVGGLIAMFFPKLLPYLQKPKVDPVEPEEEEESDTPILDKVKEALLELFRNMFNKKAEYSEEEELKGYLVKFMQEQKEQEAEVGE